jgi:excisionase family DNA binding protein
MSTKQHGTLAATVQETADMLGVSRWTVQRMIAAETIHSVKIGKSRRIPHTEIDRILGASEAPTRSSAA